MQSNCTGIICKDAGAANQIAHYVLNNPAEYRFSLQDPALTIFKCVLGEVSNLDFEEALEDSEQILTGTGWTSYFEWEGIRAGRLTGKKVITHLDHWNNYRERFTRNSEIVLPNEIWVTDEYSEKIATKYFASTKIVRKTDYYLQHQVNEIVKLKTAKNKIEENSRKKILFLSEPLVTVTESEHLVQNDEGEALKNEFMAVINDSKCNLLEIRIRLHPSEILRERQSKISDIPESDSLRNSLFMDLAWADIVVGIDSYALYVSDSAGLPTISIASWVGRSTKIPKGTIKFLGKRELVDLLNAE